MARSLLINPSYALTYGSNEGGIAYPVQPVLGLSAIAGASKQRGHETRILDLSYRPYDADLIRREITAFRPDLVGITATTPLANQMRDISYVVKDLDDRILTIAGGAHPSALPLETMRQSALDYVCAGEGDYVVADLLDGVDPATIGGLVHHGPHGPVANPFSALVEDLDDLPMPCWELYPPESNRRITKLVARYSPVMSVEFSRGCIYKCDFCGSKNTMGRGYRKKSPARCAEEMARLGALGFREAILMDDIFTSDNDWAAAVCEELIRTGNRVAWTCTNGIRVDSANRELFELMRRAGCYRVYFGFESGNDEVLRAFGKGGRATLDQGVEAVDMARAAGLEPNGFFLVGLSGDTESSMQDTIDYAKRVSLDTMKCGICIPFPGTPMFDDLQRQGKIKTLDWDAYTVYNQADEIFDHPLLDWDTINAYFRRFYVESYLRNPTYLVRRFRFMIRNNELWWNLRFTARFLRMIFTRTRPHGEHPYAFADRWRPLDLVPGASDLSAPPVPRASAVRLTGRRNGVVSPVSAVR